MWRNFRQSRFFLKWISIFFSLKRCVLVETSYILCLGKRNQNVRPCRTNEKYHVWSWAWWIFSWFGALGIYRSGLELGESIGGVRGAWGSINHRSSIIYHQLAAPNCTVLASHQTLDFQTGWLTPTTPTIQMEILYVTQLEEFRIKTVTGWNIFSYSVESVWIAWQMPIVY